MRFRWIAIVVILLAGFEAALRLTGYALLLPTSERNRIALEDAARVRILTLGESTTADVTLGKSHEPWPRMLEAELRKRGIDARVYNEAVAGTSTAMLASRLPAYLDLYRPQIVVAMMGVNDVLDIRFDDSWRSWLALTSANLRIAKIASWIWGRAAEFGLCKIDFTKVDEKFDAIVERGASLALKGEAVEKVESEIRQTLPNAGDNEIALILSAIGSGPLRRSTEAGVFDHGKFDFAEAPFYNRAFDLYPLNHDVAYWELHILARETPRGMLDPARGLMASRRLLRCGRNLPDSLLAEIALFAVPYPELAEDPAFRSRDLFVGKLHSSPTRYHYRLIHRMLRERGISLVAMQYPTLPLEAVRSYFEDSRGVVEHEYDDVVFVGNQENFNAALKRHPYSDLFGDRFRGSWGHTTPLGHRIIAENVASAVLGLLRAGKGMAAP